MVEERRFLVDVGMEGLPFPVKIASRAHEGGQATTAEISVSARLMQEFEARWIDKFIQILHRHRDNIGTETIRKNILDYLEGLNAKAVRVTLGFPFFIEKRTPISNERCLVSYQCALSAKVPTVTGDEPKILLRAGVPVITTYPASTPGKPGGLFGQLSIVTVEAESKKDLYPEDLVDVVDRHCLMPVYSFLTEKDQAFVIQKVHSQEKTSVVMTDEIKDELRRNQDISWYSVSCSNSGMLHTYSTVVGTEKSMWVPFSGYDQEI